ncbi:hypothetical protein FDP41_003483 [Naegleria fowleri]|uniref:Uncharacterized protein n=1 Tax=Naegleria fowleri TaxID=5763 RepID=A0A6A5BSZ7_NAEFO|nr:uncharacterized protein FDP41_003483 [Naegleria fowleri]KAF0977491.1 hypothetical protein FDP41_003483 [Naegleria fowleri]CAG4718885.1 unnamed protein product [Naegleria fowleri]
MPSHIQDGSNNLPFVIPSPVHDKTQVARLQDARVPHKIVKSGKTCDPKCFFHWKNFKTYQMTTNLENSLVWHEQQPVMTSSSFSSPPTTTTLCTQKQAIATEPSSLVTDHSYGVKEKKDEKRSFSSCMKISSSQQQLMTAITPSSSCTIPPQSRSISPTMVRRVKKHTCTSTSDMNNINNTQLPINSCSNHNMPSSTTLIFTQYHQPQQHSSKKRTISVDLHEPTTCQMSPSIEFVPFKLENLPKDYSLSYKNTALRSSVQPSPQVITTLQNTQSLVQNVSFTSSTIPSSQPTTVQSCKTHAIRTRMLSLGELLN